MSANDNEPERHDDGEWVSFSRSVADGGHWAISINVDCENHPAFVNGLNLWDLRFSFDSAENRTEGTLPREAEKTLTNKCYSFAKKLPSLGAAHMASLTEKACRHELVAASRIMSAEAVMKLWREADDLYIPDIISLDRQHLANLLPTDAEYHEARSRSQLKQLHDEGDDSKAEHEVEYFICHVEEDERDVLHKTLIDCGFRVMPIEGEQPDLMRAVRKQPVEDKDILDIEKYLMDLAGRHGAVYDGWEAPVVPFEDQSENLMKRFSALFSL